MKDRIMIQSIAQYFKTQPVVKAWIFGSFSRGEERPDSDVDILVNLDHDKPFGKGSGERSIKHKRKDIKNLSSFIKIVPLGV